MYPFIETIRIEQGKACNLSYHNERLNNTLHHFWPDCAGIELGEYLKLTPEMSGMKCRVIYDGGGIKEYGSYGIDKPYVSAVRDLVRESGFTDVPIRCVRYILCSWFIRMI